MRVLELFKGTGSVEKAFKSIDKDIEVISLDIEKKYNPTHLCNILDFDYKQYPNNYFDIIWGSPPCDKFSQLRNCWKGRKMKNGIILTDEIILKDIQTIGLPPLYKLKEIINYFKPKYYFIENPASSKMKNYIDNNFLYDINKYIVSYCKYGFDYRKNTAIWTNLKGFNPKKCKNDCDSIITIPSENITKKHKINLEKIGSGTNRDDRYRIPQPLLIELFSLCNISQTENHKQIFTNIYDKNIWGNSSGKGSSIEYNKKYIEYLEKIIKEKNINSILDLGCGDWNFSKIINYDNINYLGIDCVDKVIKSNIENYKKNNINFICDDIYNLDNFFKNEIDLVIIKDVLQHLSDEEIELFLNKLLEKNFKYLLITNAFSKEKIDRNVNTRYRYSKLNVNHYPLNNYFNNENIIDKFNYKYKQVVFISQTENHTKMK